MARLDPKSREARRRKAQKGLEGLEYIPRIAKILSEAMIVLAESSEFHKKMVLSEFSKIANKKPTWTIAGRRK